MIILPEEIRKDTGARKDAIESADIAFFCLPDDAAKEMADLMADSDTVIIDTSTAHRTAEGWTYGMAELRGGAQRELIRNSKRISNPGCHASGFIALIAPLIQAGLIKDDAALSCFSITGYSGGGKKMIADYEDAALIEKLTAPRQYGIAQSHKHLKEMQALTGLKIAPIFNPIVSSYYSGMEVSVGLFARDLSGSMEDIKNAYSAYDGLIKYCEQIDQGGFISAAEMSGRDDMLVSVTGNDERMVLTALFDNLGKGASGAAIQNMNIVMGACETTGLVTSDEDK